jgi:hypothetical protein
MNPNGAGTELVPFHAASTEDSNKDAMGGAENSIGSSLISARSVLGLIGSGQPGVNPGMPIPSGLKPADLLYLADLASTHRPTSSLTRNVSLMDDLPPLPPPNVLGFLIDVFFLTAHQHSPIFHREVFMRNLASQPLFLVWGMCAAACSFLPSGNSTSRLAKEINALQTPEVATLLRGKRRFAVQTNLVERTKRVLLRVVQATVFGEGVEVTRGFRIAKLASLILLGMATALRFFKGAMEFTDALIVG